MRINIEEDRLVKIIDAYNEFVISISRTDFLYCPAKHNASKDITFMRASLCSVGYSICFGTAGCGLIKEVSLFAIKKSSGKCNSLCRDCQRKYHDEYFEEHRDEQLCKGKIRYENNKEAINEQKKGYYQENKEHLKQKRKEWKEDNRDRVRYLNQRWAENNRDKDRASKRKWKKNHPEEVRAHKRKRRDSIRGKQKYPAADERITLFVFDNKCFKCGSTHKLCVDHHYCLNKGNQLSIDNAVVLCVSCNGRKWTKDPEDFYTDQELCSVRLLLDRAVFIKNSGGLI
jgi:hypothetical protein